MTNPSYEKKRVEILRGIRTLDRAALEQTLETILENVYPESRVTEWDHPPASIIARSIDTLRVKAVSRVVALEGTFVKYGNKTVFAAGVIGGTPMPAGTYEFDGAEWSLVKEEKAPEPVSDLPKYRIGEEVTVRASSARYFVNHITRDGRGKDWKYNLLTEDVDAASTFKTNVLESDVFKPDTSTEPRWDIRQSAYKIGDMLHVGSVNGQVYTVVRNDSLFDKMPIYVLEEPTTGMAMTVTEDSLFAAKKAKK